MVCNLHSSKPNPADDFKKFNQFIGKPEPLFQLFAIESSNRLNRFLHGIDIFQAFFFTDHFWTTQTWTVWEHLIHISNETPDSFQL